MKNGHETLCVLTAIAAGWFFGGWFGSLILPYLFNSHGDPQNFFVRLIGGGILCALVYFTLLPLAARAASNVRTAPSTTTLRRRVVGFVANTLLLIPVVIVAYLIFAITTFLAFDLASPLKLGFNGNVVITIINYTLHYIFWKRYGKTIMAALRGVIGRSVSALASAFHIGKAGRGGSSRFAGLFTEWANQWKSGVLLLGSSLYAPKLPVGIKDDRHILTIAASASGKGRSAIIPNLMIWPGSAIVIDPKGTNAAVTAAARGQGGGRVVNGMGHAVYVFDPFGVTAGKPGVPAGVRINPLADIDPQSLTFYEDCDRVAESLVIPGKGDPHWDESARALIRGLIAHAVTAMGVDAHLGHVRDLLTQAEGPPLKAMYTNTRAGTLAREVAAQLMAASDREYASIVSTAIRHTDWLASAAMRDALCAAEFRFEMLKTHPTTLYAVLPPHFLKTHARALRAIVNAGIGAATKGGRSRVPILFILDEFYSLGRMDTLATAIANIRSYNVRLWPILQNLAQLEELYGRNWTSFWANTGQVQVFATNDKATQEHVAAQLGNTILWSTDEQGRDIPAGRAPLRDPQEIARELSRAGGRQLIFREGELPLILRRINYDEAFPQDAFNPDPDHPERPAPLWQRLWKAIKPRGLMLPTPQTVAGVAAPANNNAPALPVARISSPQTNSTNAQ